MGLSRNGFIGRQVVILWLGVILLSAGSAVTAAEEPTEVCRLDQQVLQTGMAVIGYPDEDAGAAGSGLRLVSQGKVRNESGSVVYTIWAVRNGSDLDSEVVVDGYGSSFQISFTALAHSETFLRSDFKDGAAAHRLFYNGAQIDVKAAGDVDYVDERPIPCLTDEDQQVLGTDEEPEASQAGGGDQDLLAYEGFDYAAGDAIHQHGAAENGWGGPWKNVRSAKWHKALVADGSLSYGNLEVSGNHVVVDNTTAWIYRPLASAVGAVPGTEIWLSVIIGDDSGHRIGAWNVFAPINSRYGYSRDGKGIADRLFDIGIFGRGDHRAFRIRKHWQNSSWRSHGRNHFGSGSVAWTPGDHFVVIRISIGSETSHVAAWVDPDDPTDLGAPDLTLKGHYNGSVSFDGVMWHVEPFHARRSARLDEIRIGRSAASVTQGLYPAPSAEFSVQPAVIHRGQSATLSWSTSHADTVTIEPGIGPVAASGTLDVSPEQTTAYTLTVGGPGGISSESVTVSVENSPPQAQTRSLTTEEDTAVEVTLAGSDRDNDPLSFRVLAGPTNGSLNGDPPAVIYTPRTNYNGPDAFTFVVNDGSVDSEPAGVSFEVTPVNDAPVAVGDSAVTLEDAAVVVDNVLANDTDVDGDTLLVSDFSQSTNGSVTNLGGGRFEYTPAPDYFGEDSFTYTVSDGGGRSDVGIVTITVTPVNDAPVANPAALTLDEDGDVPAELTAVDIEGAALIFEIVSAPSHGTLSGEGAALTYRPNPNYSGFDSFVFRAFDGELFSEPATVTLTIQPVNDAPVGRAGEDITVFVRDPVTLDAGQSYDIDGDTLNFQWTLARMPQGSTAALQNASSSSAGFVADIAGTYEVELIVGDGSAFSAPDVVVVTAVLRTVFVPDVVNRNQADAEAAIRAAGLSVGAVTPANSETVSSGQVISQAPAAGQTVEEGTPVDLVISLGPSVQVPTAVLEASPSTIAIGETTTLSWHSLHAGQTHIDSGVGSVEPSGSITVSPEHTTTYTITVTGTGGSAAAKAVVYVTGNPEPQPEGSFGEKYEDLVPPDATVEAYDPDRFSLITGTVQDVDAFALAEVSIVIHAHPEYGTAVSDENGQFSIPVEGGGTLTVVYRKDGLLPAQRKVYVPWNDNAIVETVRLTAEDSTATTLTFDGNPETVVAHTGAQVQDEDGQRACTMVLTGDNKAYLVDEAGNDVRALETITVRASEYTTPESMPAKLPPTSAFTYCVELTVDGAERVRFEKPVILWVDNFLGFPVGAIVPVGYYDRDRAVWVPSENGRVVALLDTDNDGVVEALDADGDGLADDLDQDGSYEDEIQGIDDTQRHAPGSSFWRAAVKHFSPYDFNWSFGLLPGATPPTTVDRVTVDQLTIAEAQVSGSGSIRGIQCINSYVEMRSRVFHEDIAIQGTEMTLHYASDRAAGYKPAVLTIPASAETVPELLVAIVVEVDVAGRHYRVNLPPEPNQIAEVVWDGLDHLGRPVSGPVMASVKIGFVYFGVYFRPNSGGLAFGQTGFASLAVPTRQPVTLWQTGQVFIIRGQGTIADGWTLSGHHWISALSPGLLFKGDGTISRNNAMMIDTYGGTGTEGFSDDGGLATEADLNLMTGGLTVDAAGNLYFCENSYYWIPTGDRIRKVDRNGVITSPVKRVDNPISVAVDSQGNIYVAEHTSSCITKFDPSGRETVYAGICGQGGYGGDNGPATQARINYPADLEFDDQGNLYFADMNNHRIRKVDPAGIITTVAGTGARGYSPDGVRATEAQLTYPSDIAADAAGNLYFAERYTIRKVDTSGIVSTVAGNGEPQISGDGGPAIEAGLDTVDGIEIDATGNLYIASWYGQRVRKVDTSGIITTIAGSGPTGRDNGGFGGDGGPATMARLNDPFDVTVDAAGNIFIVDYNNERIRVVRPPAARLENAMTASDIAFTEENGLAYIMSPAGLHKKTIDLATGTALREFGYDPDGNLISIQDQFDNTIVIERDAAGIATAIVSPDGIRTELSIDDNNHLTRVGYEDGSFYDFTYTADGLMTEEIEPNGNRFEHVFDPKGRLNDVVDEEGGHWTYSRTVEPDGDVFVEVTSAENNHTTFLDHTYSDGRYTSTATGPDGGQAEHSQSADGLTVNESLACGTDLVFNYDLDPEYKFKFVKKLTESAPSGLQKVTSKGRVYEDTDADGLPDRISETITINGKAARLVNDVPQATSILTSPQGRTITEHYNPDTLATETVEVPGLYDTVFSYDGHGRLTSVRTDTRESTLAYNGRGLLLESITDPQKYTTQFVYDPVGRVTRILRSDTSVLEFEYDENGNMTMLVNPAGIYHEFDYNRVNNQSAYHTPLSGSYQYKYDKDRRFTDVIFPSGKAIRNVYEDGRLVQTETPEGVVDYEYLCAGKAGSISKHGEKIAYDYDGKLITREMLTGTVNQQLSYLYDNDFEVTELSYAGETSAYAYDNDGLLTGAGAFTINRDAGNGLPLGVSDGTLTIARSFNGYGEIDSQAVSTGGRDVSSWSVSRDGKGRIIRKTESLVGIASEFDYEYDSIGRLRKVFKDGVLVEEYRYNANGTRIYEMNALLGITGESFDYSDEDHLLIAGDTHYHYDQDGFLTNKTNPTNATNSTSYLYSSRGELLRVTLPDGKVIEYVNDPLGRRIAKKVDGEIVEKYLWQGLTRLLAVYDGSDNLLMRFEYADDRMPVAMLTEGVKYYLAYDQVGSLRAVADSAGNVVKRIAYDSFGNIIEDSNNAFVVPFGFAGGLHDRDTGLVRFGYRDYDPDTGRWTARDPIFFAGGDTDLYGYCLNDPISWVDPGGLFWQVVGANAISGGISGAVGGAILGGILGGLDAGITGAIVGSAAGFVAGGISGTIGGLVTGMAGGGIIGTLVGGFVGGTIGEMLAPSSFYDRLPPGPPDPWSPNEWPSDPWSPNERPIESWPPFGPDPNSPC